MKVVIVKEVKFNNVHVGVVAAQNTWDSLDGTFSISIDGHSVIGITTHSDYWLVFEGL